MTELNKILLGLNEDHLVYSELAKCKVHHEVQESLESLIKFASTKGHDIVVVSSFRSYERQLHIWNQKACGHRELLDSKGGPLNYQKLTPLQICRAILRWSAIPGASRHHWGTEFDLIDRNALPDENYQVQLTPKESSQTGLFGNFHHFMDQLIEKKKAYHFYRPYSKDLGGVSPERWHYSYGPLSSLLTKSYTQKVLEQALENKDLALRDHLKEIKEELLERYILNIQSYI